MITEFLSNLPLFQNLSRLKLDQISQKIKIKYFQDSNNVITQGDSDQKLYIIKSGQIEIFKDGVYKRTLKNKECFGERALYMQKNAVQQLLQKEM